jgi:hypothetical protein
MRASNVNSVYIPCLLQLIEEEVDMRDVVHSTTVDDLEAVKEKLDGALERIEELENKSKSGRQLLPSPKAR